MTTLEPIINSFSGVLAADDVKTLQTTIAALCPIPPIAGKIPQAIAFNFQADGTAKVFVTLTTDPAIIAAARAEQIAARSGVKPVA